MTPAPRITISAVFSGLAIQVLKPQRTPFDFAQGRLRFTKETSCCQLSILAVTQYLVRCVAAGGTRDTSAGMRSGAAKIEAIDRGAVLRPACDWPHKEKLLQAQIAVEDVALGQSVGALKV